MPFPLFVVMACIIWFFTVVLVLLTILLTVRLLTSEVRVSKDHLSWRTWRGTQTILWRDVLDYFETDQRGLYIYDWGPKRKFIPMDDFETSFACLIKTPYGDCQFSQAWPQARRLREMIAARAVNARADEWGLLGTRPKLDLPTKFDYDNAMSRWVLALTQAVCYLLIAAASLYFGPMLWRAGQVLASTMGWGWGIVPLLMGEVYLLLMFGVPLISLPGFGELRRRQAQSILLSETGLLYRDSTREIEVQWHEITRLTTGAMNQMAFVETQRGIFDFRANLSHYRILKSAIETMTREILPSGWKPKIKERFDKPLPQADGAQSFGNERFYSYRTRTMRGILLVGSIYFGGFTCLLGPSMLTMITLSDLGWGWSIFSDATNIYLLLGLFLTIWGWSNYFTGGIQTDTEGITQLTVFGPRSISWTNVREVKSVGAGAVTWVRVSDGKQRIWFTPLIADSKELLAEIKRRTQQEPELS